MPKRGKALPDVCLIVEGTYPYVFGGVASWVHTLITSLPDLRFALVHIGTHPRPSRMPIYDLPPNVVALHEIDIHDPRLTTRPLFSRTDRFAWVAFREFHAAIASGDWYEPSILRQHVHDGTFAGLRAGDILSAIPSWDVITTSYQASIPNASFLDYFWTYRLTLLPIFAMIAAKVPEAQMYHAVSAGYAGFLGALARLRTQKPFILTEHGNYVWERELEMAQSPLSPTRDVVRQGWLNAFRFLSRTAYASADTIVGISAASQRFQLALGATPEKLLLIPNGVDSAQFTATPRSRRIPDDLFHVALVGRVVPVKDIATFLRAIAIARQEISQLDVAIIGPTDEDQAYFAECQQLVEMLDLAAIVRFTGRVEMSAIYQTLDLLVLTSLSEGQPLVILEASAAGIPIVATGIGACRELVEGTTEADCALGVSGFITAVGNPDETAQAITQLWRDADLRTRMGTAGQARMARFYRQDTLIATYRALYQRGSD